MNDHKYNIDSIYLPVIRGRRAAGLSLVIACVALLWTGCGRLYEVAPLVKTDQLSTGSGILGDLEIGVSGFDGDRALEQFEGNLPMAGVLAVEVRVKNQGPESVRLTELGFTIIDKDGQRPPVLRPEKALQRVMKFYGNRIYQVYAHQETVESYQRIALRQTGDLASREEIQGILFFAVPRQAPLRDGFMLQVRRSGQTVDLAITAP